MKTKSTLVATFSVVAFILSNLNVSANNKSSYSQKDYPLTMSFYRTDTILVVMPNTLSLSIMDKTEIESYVICDKKFKRPIYIYKPESEVTKIDCNKHLLFYGSFSSFQRKDFLRIPIEKNINGFKFNNHIYNQPNDSFFYINEKGTRMYVCKNSDKAKPELLSIGTGNYPLHIFRGDNVVITGVYLQD